MAGWKCWCRSCTRARQTPVLPEKPWPEHTRHVTSENGWAMTTTILQLAATLDDVMNPSKEGQSWILLWDTASNHASEGTMAAMKAKFPHIVLCFIPPHSTSFLQPCDLAVFRSFTSWIQAQASAHSCPLRHRRLVRRRRRDDQGKATTVFGRMGSSRSHEPLRQKPGVDGWLASLACPQRRRFPRCCDGGRGTPCPR